MVRSSTLLSVEELCVGYSRDQAASRRPFWRRGSPRQLCDPSETAGVLHRLNLKVESGDLLVILGPSGSGKTTLLRSVAGLTIPDSGRILIDGSDVSRIPPHRRDLALVFQNGGWYDHLTVLQHFQFDGLTADRIQDWMQRLELTELKHRRPSELSGGQAQRLAIGRALLRNRSLLLLDEPLSQLDQSIRDSLRQLLRDMHAEGRTLVYVTHDQQDAMLLATKIAILHRGQIQQLGSTDELFRLPNHRCVAEMLGQPTMQFFQVNLSTIDYSQLKCSMTSDGGLASDESLVAIEQGLLAGAVAHRADASVQIGIRPSAWRVGEARSAIDERTAQGCLNIPARLVEQQFLGHQLLLHFAAPGTTMPMIQVLQTRRLNGPTMMVGECYRLSVERRELHLFDAETCDRIRGERRATEKF